MCAKPFETSGKILIFRLSSLGDVLLATAALEVPSISGTRVEWVVAQEFASVLRGHPKIHVLREFDRRAGFIAWVRFCRELWNQRYSQVIDLHGSLRTRVARVLFVWWGLFAQKPEWIGISKSRWRTWGYFVFKKAWPIQWRPVRRVEMFGRAAGGSGTERPDLTFLRTSLTSDLPEQLLALLPSDGRYLCAMPGAQWPGKRWPAAAFAEVLQRTGIYSVVLGTERDAESRELVERLREAGVPHYSGVGAWSLPQVAKVLAWSVGYLGNDTGLAHLAEAVGVPANVVYGPTARDTGFGPWRPESAAFGADLWCRPCSKDGRACFRLFDRYKCLRDLRPHDVQVVVKPSESS